MLNIQVREIASVQPRRKAITARRARSAASRSPYAAGLAKTGAMSEETTPGTTNAMPM